MYCQSEKDLPIVERAVKCRNADTLHAHAHAHSSTRTRYGYCTFSSSSNNDIRSIYVRMYTQVSRVCTRRSLHENTLTGVTHNEGVRCVLCQVVTDYTDVNTENSSVCVYVRARPPDPSWTVQDDDASVEEIFQNPLQATLAGVLCFVSSGTWGGMIWSYNSLRQTSSAQY